MSLHGLWPVASGNQPFLDEENLRGMVRSLRENAVPPSEGRDDVEWHPKAWASKDSPEHFKRIVQPFSLGIPR